MSPPPPMPSSFRDEALSMMSSLTSVADLTLTAITEAEDAEAEADYLKDLRDKR